MAKQFTIRALVTYSTVVTVSADDAQQALERFRVGKWDDNGLSNGVERIDWERSGEPEAV